MKFADVSAFTLVALCLQFLLRSVKSDVYLHNPRGSNNRLNGAGVNRRNGNRVFDSQNNAKGGYNAGVNSTKGGSKDWYHMEYFMSGPNAQTEGKARKSILTIEWTNQHGCGDGDLNCNLVLQYKCEPSTVKERPYMMRNGKNTATPQYVYRRKFWNKSWKDRAVLQDNRGYQRALNEPWEWYDKCSRRERNRGLFTADQRLRGKTSKYTRQNPAGTRRGYECPEERDYFPYWHPTDWIDIAVLVNDTKDCAYYQRESFNVKPKGECMERYKDGTWKHASFYNNAKDCRKNGGQWVEFSNYLVMRADLTTKTACEQASTKEVPLKWGIPYRSQFVDTLNKDSTKWGSCLVELKPPDCKEAPYSRSNHLGNGEGIVPLSYDWVLPYIPKIKNSDFHRCVLRLRYNISTNDYNVSKTFSESNQQKSRGIITTQSPIVNNPVFYAGKDEVPLQLAINTAQFARTFQDRSHIFHLMRRPVNLNEATIYNLNVRGKRGNIVQVYPAVEYDFVPTRLEIEEGDLVHVQWTGSNTNPVGNAGQGRRQTDRNNLVQMKGPDLSYPSDDPTAMFRKAEIVRTKGNEETKTPEDVMVAMATSGRYKSVQKFENAYPFLKWLWRNPRKYKEYAELDHYPPSYSAPLLKFSKGTYYFLCTRNNNFTNRRQKGRLTVK